MRYVTANKTGTIGIIALKNEQGGFMTRDMVKELESVICAWEVAGDVRSIVITGGSDDTFVTHYDLQDAEDLARLPHWARMLLKHVVWFLLKTHTLACSVPPLRRLIDALVSDTRLDALTEVNRINGLFRRLQLTNMTVVAAINGDAMGAGCELALACDYRLMAQGDYAFGLPEAISGVFPGAGGTQRMARVIGPHKASELILDGVLLNAEEAEKIGLITRAVPKARLLDEAMALAGRLARRPPLSVGAVKRAIWLGIDLPLNRALELEKAAFLATGFSDDCVASGRYYFANYRSGKTPRQIFAGYRDGTAVEFRGQ